MGNQMSVPLRTEDRENESADTYKVMLDRECVQNGKPVIVSTHMVQHYDEVDLGISIPRDNVATSSPKTMEPNAVSNASGKNLGKEANPEAPAARSRFFLILSRPVPGRPENQGTDSTVTSGRLDVSPSTEPVNKDLSECGSLPVAAAPGQAADKTPGWIQAEDQALTTTSSPASPTPESDAEAPSKPKDFSFFDRFFKLDKGREKSPVDSQQQEAQRAEDGDLDVSVKSHGVPEGEDIVDSKEREERDVETSSGSVTGDPEALETPKEDPQVSDTTDDNSSIMSFFKTLVSPNKTETKKDPEDKGTENSPTTSVNFTPQDTQDASKSPKGCNQPGHVPPVTTSDPGKEGGKEKSGPTSMPLGKLFWKKSVKEDSVSTGAEENVVRESPVETQNFEEAESALQTVDLSEEDRPEPAEVKVQEGTKPRRTPLMAFLRQMSVKGNGGTTHPEEISEKDSSCQTSNSTEKVPTPPAPEPTGTAQKSKESASKDKKLIAEASKQKSSKQDAREAAQCAQPPTAETNSLQSGDKPPKRAEKRRQSLGGFLKGLGPKRMLDAQVQTDPVSIGPVGKSK